MKIASIFIGAGERCAHEDCWRRLGRSPPAPTEGIMFQGTPSTQITKSASEPLSVVGSAIGVASFGSDAVLVKRGEIVNHANEGIGVLEHSKNPDHQKRVRAQIGLLSDNCIARRLAQAISITTFVQVESIEQFNQSSQLQAAERNRTSAQTAN